MPVYNEEASIKKAIKTVIDQTYKKFELIVIDDGSTDGTSNIVKTLQKLDERIIYLRNEENRGTTYSLNRGLRKASGEYIARIDGDDWYHPRKLELQVKFLERRSEYGIVGTFYILVDESGHAVKVRLPVTHSEIMKRMAYRNAFAHSSIMVRRSVLDMVGYYDERYEYAQDYDLYFRILEVSKGYNLPSYLLYRMRRRQGRRTLTKRTLNSILIPLRHRRILRRNVIYYPLLARRLLTLGIVLILP
ncbi:MAG: glycosyl transferase [Thaumarchaeota archaeon]|nr:MAG: glycosyl transferase [Nitrososphaerota archaeon]